MSIFDKDIVTLNIEADSVRLFHAKGGKIRAFGEAPIPPGLISAGVINESEPVSLIVSSLFKSLKVPKNNVLVAMSGFRSIVRYVSLPKVAERNLDEAVMWAAEREMPVSLSSLGIWWRVMERTGDEQNVFMLGVPRNILEALKTMLFQADVKISAIDSKPLTLCRLAVDDNAIITNLENNSISVIVKSNGIPVIIQTLLMTAENYEVEDKVKRLSDDLFRTIEYFNNQHSDRQIDRNASVYVTGGIVNDEVNEMVRRNIGRTTSIPDVLVDIPENFSCCTYAVNLGLFLREAGIKHLNPNRQNKKVYVKPDMRNAVTWDK